MVSILTRAVSALFRCSVSVASLSTLSRRQTVIGSIVPAVNFQALSTLSKRPAVIGSTMQTINVQALESQALLCRAVTPFPVVAAGYKTRRLLKKRCPHCFFVQRGDRLFVECKVKPRHKQMQMVSKRLLFRED